MYRSWLQAKIDAQKETIKVLTQAHTWMVTEAENAKEFQSALQIQLTQRAEWYAEALKIRQAQLVDLEVRLEELKLRSISRRVYGDLLNFIRHYRNNRK